MVDFGVFDCILDSVFVVDSTGKVVYCNEPAAMLCQTSIRRITNKAILTDLIEFEELPWPFNESFKGWAGPTPLVETKFRVPKVEKTGKLQVCIYPTGDGESRRWVFWGHSVDLEENLHGKYLSELSQKEGYIAELEEARRKLEDYSKNLEKIVEQRTAELRQANENLNAMMNSLGQGFLTFNAEGRAGDLFTRACLDILEANPKGMNLADVLKIPPEKMSEFQMWVKAIYSEALPFDDLKPLGPTVFPHSKQKYVTIDYYPIRESEKGKLREVVLVATDKTAERLAQIELDKQRQHAAMIIKYVKNKEQFLQFLQAANHYLSQVENMAKSAMNAGHIAESFRLLHTLEGEAGTFSLLEVRLASRRAQQVLEPFKSKEGMTADAQMQFREALVETKKELDRFLEENSQLIQLPKEGVGRSVEIEVDQLNAFAAMLRKNSSNQSIVDAFQDRFLKEKVEKRLTHFDGLVQNVAEKLGKKVKPLKITGGDMLIHPEPFMNLFASLVHVFRNAVDHGIEPPEERTWAEKEEAGQISIGFEQAGKNYRLTIQDDGQGIDPQSIRKKLGQTHPQLDTSKQTDDEVIQNIFLPGFSSREEIGEFSGRGVGMDAVREEVVKLGGSVKVYSEAGKGTKFVLEFPSAGANEVLARSA